MTRAEAVAENTAAWNGSQEGSVHRTNEPPLFRNWDDPSYFRLQGDEVSMTDAVPFSEDAVGDSETKSQTVTFLDGDAGVLIDRTYSTNPFAIVDDTKDISLGSFLARPTLIDTLTWATSDVEGVFKTIKPWFLFLNNTVIKKKLDNFAYIRGNPVS